MIQYFFIKTKFIPILIIILLLSGCLNQKAPPKSTIESTKSLNKMITIYIDSADIKTIDKEIEITIKKKNISKIILFDTKPFKIIKKLNKNHLRHLSSNNIITTNTHTIISSKNHKMLFRNLTNLKINDNDIRLYFNNVNKRIENYHAYNLEMTLDASNLSI